MLFRKSANPAPCCIIAPPEEYSVFKLELPRLQALRIAGLYESVEDSALREEVLGHLNSVVQTWVRAVAQETGFDYALTSQEPARIFTFGSYRLGVHGPGRHLDPCWVFSWRQ